MSTIRTLAWLDCETTGLHAARRAWEIGLITRHPGERDIEWQWFVHPLDLDLGNAEPAALEFGRFYDRHPHGAYLKAGGDPLETPMVPGVFRSREILWTVAQETDKALILGSNPAFDVHTLTPEMGRWGLTPSWHYHTEDVPTLVKGWLLGRGLALPESGKSDDYCRAVGLDPASYGRHEALGDCRLFRDAYDVVTDRR